MSRKKFRSGRKTLFSLLKRPSFLQSDLQIAVLILLTGTAWVQVAVAADADQFRDSGSHPWSAVERKALEQIREKLLQDLSAEQLPEAINRVAEFLQAMELEEQQALLEQLLHEDGASQAALIAWLEQLQEQLSVNRADDPGVSMFRADTPATALESEWSGNDASGLVDDKRDDPVATVRDADAGAVGAADKLGFAPALFPVTHVLGGIAVAGGAVAFASGSSGSVPIASIPPGDGGDLLPPPVLNGVALDGYVADAQIFVRTNDGLVLVGGTDAQGRYVDLTGALGLRLSTDHAGLPMVLRGGTDLSTGAAFQGEMTAPAGAQVISPLTTLVQSLIEADVESPDLVAATDKALQTVVTALGLEGLQGNLAALLTIDPIAASQTVGADPAMAALGSDLFKAGALVNSIVSSVTDIIAAAADDAVAAVGASLFKVIFQEIAKSLVATPSITLLDGAGTATFSEELLAKTAQTLTGSNNVAVSIEDASLFMDEVSSKAFGLGVIIDDLIEQLSEVGTLNSLTGQVGGAQVQTDDRVEFLIKGIVTADGQSMIDNAQDIETLIKFGVRTVKADPDVVPAVIHIELGAVSSLSAAYILQKFPLFDATAQVTLSMGPEELKGLLDDAAAQSALRTKGIDRLALQTGTLVITPLQAQTLIQNDLTFADGSLATDQASAESGFRVSLMQTDLGSLSDHGLTLAGLARLGVDSVASQTGSIHLKAGDLAGAGSTALKLPQFESKDTVTLGLSVAQLPDFFAGLPDIKVMDVQTFSTVLTTTHLNRSALSNLGIDRIALVDGVGGIGGIDGDDGTDDQHAILPLTTDMGQALLQAGLSVGDAFVFTAGERVADRSIETIAVYLHGTQLDAQTLLSEVELTQLGIDRVIVGHDKLDAPLGLMPFNDVAHAAGALQDAALVGFDRDLGVVLDAEGLSIAAIEAAIAATRLADVGDQNLLSLFDLGVDRILIGLEQGGLDGFDLDPDADGLFGSLNPAG